MQNIQPRLAVHPDGYSIEYANYYWNDRLEQFVPFAQIATVYNTSSDAHYALIGLRIKYTPAYPHIGIPCDCHAQVQSTL